MDILIVRHADENKVARVWGVKGRGASIGNQNYFSRVAGYW